jgi:predicted dehydrogenase
MDKKKVGVIGVGSMGKNHVRSYAALKHVCELVGIYDIDQDKSKEMAKSYGVKSFSSISELLKEVDAVNIATPTTTHYDIALKAIEAGKHLLIEKPITNKVDEANEILKRAKENKIIVQVGHIERFNPAIKALPDMLKEEEIVAIDVQRMGPYDPRIDDTDVIQDLMIHDIDVVSSIIETDIVEVNAFARKVASKEHMDFAVTSYKTNDDIIVTLTASRATNKKVRKMSITTEKSFIELDYLNRKITRTRRDNGEINKNKQREYEETYENEEEPLKMQLIHFVNSIENETRPMISGHDGLEALKLIKLIQSKVY